MVYHNLNNWFILYLSLLIGGVSFLILHQDYCLFIYPSFSLSTNRNILKLSWALSFPENLFKNSDSYSSHPQKSEFITWTTCLKSSYHYYCPDFAEKEGSRNAFTDSHIFCWLFFLYFLQSWGLNSGPWAAITSPLRYIPSPWHSYLMEFLNCLVLLVFIFCHILPMAL